jgi:hypothetical protein
VGERLEKNFEIEPVFSYAHERRACGLPLGR